MKRSLAAALALILAGCAPQVPDSGADAGSGVGFGNYNDYTTYRAQRDAELAGAERVTAQPLPPVLPADVAAAEVAGPASGPAPIDNPSISDEQDFDAVSSRETIESDAERLRAQRDAYQVIEPTALPDRAGDGPNVVAFALSTQHAVGQKVYRRTAFPSANRYQKNCGQFLSADLAQEAFLAAGGPERDKLGMDPDGDGFACDWDPSPYRRISASR